MHKYNRFDDDEEGIGFLKKTALILFVALYPLVVSMYPMIPPFIGLAGYVLILHIEKEKTYMIAPLFYLLNLDLNLSLPLFLSIFIIIFVYMFIYMPLKRLIRCKVCLLFALIVIIDFLYYISLFFYDFIFTTTTVLADMLLVYYIVIDILLGVLL
ncbi:MAG: Unknown protein [uncultured Sulfurovum sp.]|uniref:Uncharacterized protein n=1 Tax=uncultured Sulfurovum sp. TaxID=269237 RepID=A0A6S6TTG8_9BACT|nr:MAG: Unknown protein [uncultured Sulfurovum sp.]